MRAYRCERCDVLGFGAQCWNCEQSDLLCDTMLSPTVGERAGSRDQSEQRPALSALAAASLAFARVAR